MDQKNKIVARLEERFGASSLPGPTLDQELAAAMLEKAAVASGSAAPVPAAAVMPAAPSSDLKESLARLRPRFAHLDQELREHIEALLLLEQNYPIRGYLTEDLQRAGVVVGEAVREYHWPEFRRYSRLFFGPAHEAICTVFQKELQAVARHHGKNRVFKQEVEPYAEH